jgi:hypothetical protein
MDIIFRLTIIFALTKHRKMPKSFSRNHFTPNQTLIRLKSILFFLLSLPSFFHAREKSPFGLASSTSALLIIAQFVGLLGRKNTAAMLLLTLQKKKKTHLWTVFF